jgi:hypothetical protein
MSGKPRKSAFSVYAEDPVETKVNQQFLRKIKRLHHIKKLFFVGKKGSRETKTISEYPKNQYSLELFQEWEQKPSIILIYTKIIVEHILIIKLTKKGKEFSKKQLTRQQKTSPT